MEYSIYANIQDLTKRFQTTPDWGWYYGKYPRCKRDIMWAKTCWDTCVGEWHGGSTEKVLETLNSAHPYEAELTTHIADNLLTNEFYKKKFKYRNRQVCGQRVDIARFLSGDQRCWSTVKRERVPNPSVRVYAPMGGTGEVEEKEMRVCGALTAALCEALETEGIGVELWACCCAEYVFSSNGDITQMIKIKDSSTYCDLGLISYITGSSGFYRNIIFKDRILAGLDVMVRTNGKKCFKNIGGSYNFSERVIPKDEDTEFNKDIVLPRIYDMDRAKEYLEDNIEKVVTQVKGNAYECA
jgi:hypothetical protein